MSYYNFQDLGPFVDDATCLLFIQLMEWDTNGDGTGNPRPGMRYWDSTLGVPKQWTGAAWAIRSVDTFTGPGTTGIVPDPGAASGLFLRDDGSFAAAGGGSSGIFSEIDVTAEWIADAVAQGGTADWKVVNPSASGWTMTGGYVWDTLQANGSGLLTMKTLNSGASFYKDYTLLIPLPLLPFIQTWITMQNIIGTTGSYIELSYRGVLGGSYVMLRHNHNQASQIRRVFHGVMYSQSFKNASMQAAPVSTNYDFQPTGGRSSSDKPNLATLTQDDRFAPLSEYGWFENIVEFTLRVKFSLYIPSATNQWDISNFKILGCPT